MGHGNNCFPELPVARDRFSMCCTSTLLGGVYGSRPNTGVRGEGSSMVSSQELGGIRSTKSSMRSIGGESDDLPYLTADALLSRSMDSGSGPPYNDDLTLARDAGAVGCGGGDDGGSPFEVVIPRNATVFPTTSQSPLRSFHSCRVDHSCPMSCSVRVHPVALGATPSHLLCARGLEIKLSQPCNSTELSARMPDS